MERLLIAVVSFLASGLTLFSGFGLGTVLLPVFAVFFPLELAIGMTAVVHFSNNLFKLALFGRHIDRDVVRRFGLPAIAGAFGGAAALAIISGSAPLVSYSVFGRTAEVTLVKLTVSFLMVSFALFEVLPSFRNAAFGRKCLTVGGVLSGFFGGLSGHQGALRGAFLIQCGLSKERYIGTGIAIACLVDISRLFVYGSRFAPVLGREHWKVAALAAVSAVSGAFLANRFLEKITVRALQGLVSVLLALIALGLASGIL